MVRSLRAGIPGSRPFAHVASVRSLRSLRVAASALGLATCHLRVVVVGRFVVVVVDVVDGMVTGGALGSAKKAKKSRSLTWR